MLANNVIYCKEKWRVSWFWLPRDWCLFGWHKIPFDGVVCWSLNIGPLSIYNEWVPASKNERGE